MDPNCITLTPAKTKFLNLATDLNRHGERFLSDDDVARIYEGGFNGELILPLYTAWDIDRLEVVCIERFYVDITVWYVTETGIEDKALIFRIQAPNVVVARQVIVGGSLQTQLRVVEQLRHGVGRYTMEFPGGMVNRGKSLTGVAAKEVREETGLEIPDDRFIVLGNIDRDGARSVGLTAAALVIVVPWDTPDNDRIIEQGEHIKRSSWMSIADIELYFRTADNIDGAFATTCTLLRYKMPELWYSMHVPANA
jgi:8-oxo-dGTP pyrophosphatase MutT (NUDIX family)